VPVGQVAGPFKAVDGMVVLRVDSRTDASRPAFEADKTTQRQQLVQSLRQQRVDEFLTNLRESVTVVDKRPTVMSALRRQSGV
jgi:peptidyl-prolyl cis-trans isomerase D